MSQRPVLLGVNIDHSATLRQARYRGQHTSHLAEPSPLEFTRQALLAGADGITVHLREDRRHIQAEDIWAIAKLPKVRLNLEMACTPAMLDFALELKPAAVCLVPESREEVTTEGGLDVVGQFKRVQPIVEALHRAKVEVSLFINAEPAQIQASRDAGAPVVELHTGAFAHTWGTTQGAAALKELHEGAELAHRLGIIVNAGHGINYDNVRGIMTLPHLNELNIGHSIVSRALFVGVQPAVQEMKRHLQVRA
jgi:pyridoxine 5-phosphate synthase